MRAPAVPLTRKLLLAVVMGLLACGLVPLGSAFAEGEKAPSTLLASSLMDGPASVVREDVALAAPEGDVVPEPIIGSFTVDGLTFAVIDESHVELVGIAPSVTLSEAAEGGAVEGSNSNQASEAGLANLVLPETVSYEGTTYALASIAPYAFYLSDVTDVELPASVNDVDDRAFCSSDVVNVTVAENNQTYSSFDGALYDAEHLSLLLIPEGKQGTVRIPKTAEVAEASVFSHCPLVESISVDAGSAAFASENGLLYDASLATLLRVPAGATDITIRDGCTTIAAGAMEACASLATITAPASVTSISPYLFEQEPETVMAPVSVAAVEDEAESDSLEDRKSTDAAPQLTAMVALAAAGDPVSQTDSASIMVTLADDAIRSPWMRLGFTVMGGKDNAEDGDEVAGPQDDSASSHEMLMPAQDEGSVGGLPSASLQGASSYAAGMSNLVINSDSGTIHWEDWTSRNPVGTLRDSGNLTASWSTPYYDICSWSSVANAISRTGDSLNIMMTTSGWAGRCILLTNNNPGGYDLTWTRSGGTVSATGNSTDYHLSGNVTINVTRTPKVFRVALDKDGGSGGTDAVYLKYATGWYSNAAATANITKVSIPEKGPDGKPLATSAWTFAGYKGKDKNGNEFVYVDSSGNLKNSSSWWSDFTSDTTLTAVWTKSVKLEREGGTGGSTSATYTKGKGFTSTITKPTAPSGGWTFLGYFDYSPGSDSSNASYGSVYQFFKADGTARDLVYDNVGVTLYAWWAKAVTMNKYVTSAKAGTATKVWAIKGGKLGSTCGAGAKVEDDVLAKVPQSSPLKAIGWAPTWSNAQGWTFDGYWSAGGVVSATQYIDKGGNGVIACPQNMPSTIYAQWSRPVTLVKQGGSGGSDSGAQIYSTTASNSNFPYRGVTPPTTPPGGASSGWTFLGYCDYDPTSNPAGSVYQLIKSDGSPTGRAYSATTLYAWWVKGVTLDKGHDKAVWGANAKKTINALLGAPLGYACETTANTESEVRSKFPNPSGLGAGGWAPSRPGYVFGGYYDSSTGSIRYITGSGGRGDAAPEGLGSTIYAKWYATLTFDANGGTVSMYYGTTNAPDKLVDKEDYQEMDELTVYETGSGIVPAIYDPALLAQALLTFPQARVGFLDGSDGSFGNNYGLLFNRPGYVATGMKGTSPELTTTSGTVRLVPGGTFQVQWQPKTINITWDSNGGSEVDGTSAVYSETAKVPMPESEPSLAGKKFAGWFTEREDGKGEQVTAETSLPTSDVTYYARWIDPASITFDANGGRMYLYTGSTPNEDKLVELSEYQNMEGQFTIYETGTGGTPAILAIDRANEAWLAGPNIYAAWFDDYANNYGLRFSRAGYTSTGLAGTKPELTTGAGKVRLVIGSYCVAQWRPNRYTVSFDANGATATMPDAMDVDYEQGAVLPEATGQGLAFRGWNTKADGTGTSYQAGDACDTLTQTDGATVPLYAQWTPIVSADAPIDVTVSVDLLGIEDQVPASGYIESRSGGALKVAAVDFAPLDGATALFGSRTADVALEALAGEGATSADVRFSLGSRATEDDESRLAAFALPDGFGTRIPIGYRFAIPDDVLDTIDPAIFEQKTTPVCSVYYTVALVA